MNDRARLKNQSLPYQKVEPAAHDHCIVDREEARISRAKRTRVAVCASQGGTVSAASPVRKNAGSTYLVLVCLAKPSVGRL